jgi:hypothetical protein
MLERPEREGEAEYRPSIARGDSSYENLSASDEASLFPSLAVTEGSIHVVWSEEDLASQTEERCILHLESSDAGCAWGPPDILFENHQIDGTAYRGDIASGEGAGLIATVCGYYGYTDPLGKRTYRWAAGYRMSEDGTNWGALRLSASARSEWKTIILNPPRASLDSLGIELDLITESCFTAKESDDWGETFATVIDYKEPNLITQEYLSCHDVVAEAEMVYFAAERNHIFGNEIYVIPYDRMVKDPKGLRRMDPDSTGSFRPCLGIGNGLLHVVWCDLCNGFKGIYYRRSTDNGTTFSPAVLVSEAGTDAWNPDLAVDGSTVVVVWEDYRERWGEIYSRRSTDGGETWDPPARETYTAGFSVHPRVESGGGATYLVWQDRSSGNWEVLFTQLR